MSKKREVVLRCLDHYINYLLEKQREVNESGFPSHNIPLNKWDIILARINLDWQSRTATLDRIAGKIDYLFN